MRGGVVLLAAGTASRFGSDKRTHVLPGGNTVLVGVIAEYVDQFEELIVVLRPGDEALAGDLQTQFSTDALTIVYAQDAQLGMGHSLAAGIRAARSWDFAFIALGDMPFVAPETLAALQRVMADAGPEAIVQPVYAGQPGHPVGFGRHHFTALGRLTGDAGARQVVETAAKHVVQIEVDDPGVLRDIDTPADLARR